MKSVLLFITWVLLVLVATINAAPNDAPLTEQELVTTLTDSFTANPVKTYNTNEGWSQKWQSTIEGSFELAAPLQWNPKITVLYRIPQNAQGRPLPSAENMVVYCSAIRGAQPPAKGKPSLLPDLMKPFSDDLGCTTFSLQMVTDTKHLGNKEEVYFYGGPEWVNLIQRAQEEIAKRYNFKSKKLLFYGESLGGSFAERLAVNMAEKSAGVAILNAPEVTLPVMHSNVAWFIEVNRGDGGKQINQDLVAALRMTTTPCVYTVTPPPYKIRGTKEDYRFYHAISPEAQQAAMLFLKGVAMQQTLRGENEVARWPYIRDSKRPLIYQRNDAQTAGGIPATQREYLPSKEFAEFLQTLPVPLLTTAIRRDGANQLARCMVNVPPVGRPKGIIIYNHNYDLNELSQLLNNVYFLAEHGYLVLTPRANGDSEENLRAVMSFIAKNRVLNSLSVSFIGVGKGNEMQWKLFLKQPNIKLAAQVPIGFDAGEMLNEAKWPVGAKVQWPVLFLYDQKDFSPVANEAELAQAASDLHVVKTFVDAQKKRYQVADVRFVPVGQKSDEQSAQKSIETALDFIDAAVNNRMGTKAR